MEAADGTCRHCRSHLGYIANGRTMRRTAFTACPHCDAPCLKRPCKQCSRMTGTVRIKDTPPDP